MLTGKQLLEKYAQAVLAAPESLHLTATREPGEFWSRHVLDALKLVELIPPSEQKRPLKVLDIGSGNGIPGIPMAIAVPIWSMDLLESNSKKSGFLDMFCKSTGIKNVRVLTGRAELLGRGEGRNSYDFVFARALGKLPVALELAAPFVRVGGSLIVPHGTSWNLEVKRSAKALSELRLILKEPIPYSIGRGVNFVSLLFEKIGSTPDIYPRAVGIPSKRPL